MRHMLGDPGIGKELAFVLARPAVGLVPNDFDRVMVRVGDIEI
jgi:hypothetical protein